MYSGIPIVELSAMVYFAEPIYLGGLISKPEPQRFAIESPEKLPKIEAGQVGFNIFWTLASFSYNGVTYPLNAEPRLYCRIYYNCEESPVGVRDASGDFHPFDSSSGDKIMFPL